MPRELAALLTGGCCSPAAAAAAASGEGHGREILGLTDALSPIHVGKVLGEVLGSEQVD